MAAGALVLIALAAYIPAQYRSAERELKQTGAPSRASKATCWRSSTSTRSRFAAARSGCRNHAPIPLLALYLKTGPQDIRSAQIGSISSGVYLDPASREVEADYVLDKRDPHQPVSVPAGFHEVHANRSWLVFQRCA